jgi:thioredoxin reductase (NADPH)
VLSVKRPKIGARRAANASPPAAVSTVPVPPRRDAHATVREGSAKITRMPRQPYSVPTHGAETAIPETSTEVLIVGAGPIGIELAAALRREGVHYEQLDAGQLGSTIEWWAPQTRFFSSPERIAIAGVPLATLDQGKATREEYLLYLRSVVAQFDLPIHSFQRVTGLARRPGGGFTATSEGVGDRRRWHAARVVLAIGDMHGPRRLGIPGEDLSHVSHYLAEPHRYFRRRVLIVGGKNSAVEAAIRCSRVGAEVTLSYRGADLDPERVKYWLLPEIRALLRDGRVRWLPLTVPREIRPGSVLLERLAGAVEAAGEPVEVAADEVLLLTGYAQDPDLFEQAGVTLEGPGRKPRFDEETMETDVPGLYVAGTAAAGTQLGGVRAFIENTHVHVERIVAAVTGREPPRAEAPVYELPES